MRNCSIPSVEAAVGMGEKRFQAQSKARAQRVDG